MLNRSLSPTSISNNSLMLSSLHFQPNGLTHHMNGIMPSATDEVLRLRKEVSIQFITCLVAIERGRLYQRESHLTTED